MHFEVWILPQLLNPDEYAALAGSGAQLRASIGSGAPSRRHALGQFFLQFPTVLLSDR